MSGLPSPQGSSDGIQRDFRRLVHAEWTKLWTVRSWVITTVVAALVMVLLSWLIASGSHAGMCTGPGPTSCHGEPALPVGPDGEAVSDSYSFLHEPLTGDGSITVRVVSLSGVISTAGNHVEAGTSRESGNRPGVDPWAKAGVLLTPSTRQGSAYAAVMVTGGHGVRMQDDYVHDTPGVVGAVNSTSPRWLRLTRAGDTITGYDSLDGRHWTRISSAVVSGLGPTVQVGMFVTSPVDATPSGSAPPTYATATFDRVGLSGAGLTGHLTGTTIGGQSGYPTLAQGRFMEAHRRYRVGGSGDIAPAVHGAGIGGAPPETGLLGAFAALVVVAIFGALFIVSEYRRGLIRTTFTATPTRGRVLAAKALVVGAATFLPGLLGAIAAFVISRRVLRHNGNALFPISALTEIRVIVGTAALVAVIAVLALAVAAVLRRSAGAVTVVIASTVLPMIVALTVSGSAGSWLLRVTPAAGFAVQQSLVRYPQVANAYVPNNGYYPLAPWAGFAVLVAWTLLALIAANVLLRRRDA
jgi:ABC-type transport system involved in multi-copper enzyme maturation permease subunit